MPTTRAMTRALPCPTIFDILPNEILYQVLGNMSPKDYSGFSCVSRQALAVSNAKLRTELRSADRAYPVLATYLSMTGKFVYGLRQRAIESARFGDLAAGSYPLPDEDDPDL